MSRVAYVNRRYVPFTAAGVHVEDRGYQFADGVYEVIAIHRGRMIDLDRHMARLDRSLGEIALAWPMVPQAMTVVMGELVHRNRITGSGMLYLQVTRGVARRAHSFPPHARPALVMTARILPPFDRNGAGQGIAVITTDDIRWKRADIKSISLLPNVLAKQAAVDVGAYEAWMVGIDGLVTEGTASNAWIVTDDGALVTRQPAEEILNGVTRLAVLDLARETGLRIEERPFSVAEAQAAREAFLTSTTSTVRPVVRLDDAVIGDGTVGPVTSRLLDLYFSHLEGDL